MPADDSTPEIRSAQEDGVRHPEVSGSGGAMQDPAWWALPNFSHLVIWWVVMIGYYVVFNSLSARYHKGLIDLEMIAEGWYVILASGVIGALYAKKCRIIWFLISIALASLMLMLMLLSLGALKALMYPSA